MSTKDRIQQLFPNLVPKPPMQCAPLVLAYIGDTVCDLYIRTWLLQKSDANVRDLHTQASSMVRASAQAEAYLRISDVLTPEEQGIFRRGRNAHIGTIPKHASISDYRAATGFEAVIGYLYLEGNDERIGLLLQTAYRDYFLTSQP